MTVALLGLCDGIIIHSTSSSYIHVNAITALRDPCTRTTYVSPARIRSSQPAARVQSEREK
jgi:hypothetical protein